MATTKIYVVYYSTYGHVAALAEEIKNGAASVQGVEVKLWQVPETLSAEALGKMGAPPTKREDVPVITPAELVDADGLLFGFPTRFGAMPAQFTAFMAGLFCSTGCQGGGQETTMLTAVTQLVHHGMVFVPVGYTFGAGMFEVGEVKGGSPYGAGTVAGDGSRVPTQLELRQAFHQGKYFAAIAKLKTTSLLIRMIRPSPPHHPHDPSSQSNPLNKLWMRCHLNG
ncbi:hypothetical protein U9M48_040933 [Paspalum notatum var. saurae]|uniref:NAD(P)H dehydrogenase (quinone) n=1 Tax=Paspalum notatum var. saurae TaxID=547442 RepID=A0AAQ3US50_PASNO